MPFWCHSFAARRERDHAVLFKGQRDIAAAVLAGFRIVEETTQIGNVPTGFHTLFSPSGENLGTNPTREGAASYAVGLMFEEYPPWWAR